MSRTMVPHDSHGLSQQDQIILSTPGPEAQAIAREEEREAQKASELWVKEKREVVCRVMTDQQRRVYDYDIAALADETIAALMDISTGTVQTYRYEYTQALTSGKRY